jgi:type I restriction enzyme R subunit
MNEQYMNHTNDAKSDTHNRKSNFDFLSIFSGWDELKERAVKAESNIKQDTRVSCFYARSCLELMVETIYDLDKWINRPNHDATLMTLIHEKSFKDNLQQDLFLKIKLIIKMGNHAVHGKTLPEVREALQTVKELHHVLYWFARTYTPEINRATFIVTAFDEQLIPELVAIDSQLIRSSVKKIQELEAKLAEHDQNKRIHDQQILQENDDLKAKNQALLEKIAQAKEQAEKVTDSHDYHEADTRRFLIDQLLHEAGWTLNQTRDREYLVTSMPISQVNPKGKGYVDYVLWGDDDKPLAVVEAKRASISPEQGKTQAKLYADCLERQFGQRPVIFYSNGYETFMWDDAYYPPRLTQGFYTKDQIALLIKRRTNRQPFFDGTSLAAKIDETITNRHYQKAAITKILEHFETEHARKALLVMATGTGKTRTIISLVDLLTKHGWVKNILFLADRNALLSQAKKNFIHLLPRISCSVLDSSNKKEFPDSRLYFSTYPTMNNLLSREPEDRPFGIGHFDLIIIDEAHRSVYKKYRQLFEYFDGLLVGLTATPKSDIDKNTYDIFDLQSGLPTYAYEAESAYNEKFLVPPIRISVALRFNRMGIKYDNLSEEEKRQWEEQEELVEREEVLPSELDKFLFNEDTAEKMFAQLMTPTEIGGIHVEGGDVIGKTIIFAANDNHAQFLQKCFDKNYPKWSGKLAQVITYKNPYAQSLIDEFSEEDGAFSHQSPKLRIAISVDMLDTGIDVPEVVNLVFFKVIRSKVKFTQMIGRGTRLCENLFGPNQHKKNFKIFDYCGNFELFNQNPEGLPDSMAKTISQLVFEKRVNLAHLIDNASDNQAAQDSTQDIHKKIRDYHTDLLHHQVSGMNVDNFIVRPRRRQLEPFLKKEYWQNMTNEKYTVLEQHISTLPTEAEAFNEDEQCNDLANRFDNLMLTMQLDLLESGRVSERMRTQVMEIAQKLEAKTSIPAVAKHLSLLQIVQAIEFWQDIDLSSLEKIRRIFRNLVFVLDKAEQNVVYTDFEDEIISITDVTDIYSTSDVDLAQYRKKTESFIREHDNHLTIQKLKRNKPITQSDLDVLECLLLKASGIDNETLYREKILQNKPLGTFIRELLGLDISAAKEAFSDFLNEGVYNAKQIEFINQIINYLMIKGILDIHHIFEPPFTNLHDNSVHGFFKDDLANEIFRRIREINENAVVCVRAV